MQTSTRRTSRCRGPAISRLRDGQAGAVEAAWAGAGPPDGVEAQREGVGVPIRGLSVSPRGRPPDGVEAQREGVGVPIRGLSVSPRGRPPDGVEAQREGVGVPIRGLSVSPRRRPPDGVGAEMEGVGVSMEGLSAQHRFCGRLSPAPRTQKSVALRNEEVDCCSNPS
uniref:Uncharacterized protein n=1 Tax=Chromera velia CCMP2878 TaxID=1169474 RepID=A0A0G4FHL5_9ALVE|eukprot:Cvel_17037.t1-p1 / transcript=Cvel_17037.t1 / gene=Cvel_17037 / organism=Chromera_velia_CCMP2878 / gene_product=hypothetical protein / transcript_product=hypothetical protein / location=Cvel_scaffold1340:46721-48318(-) / protein_length=166 / sequence_SO=supercontig / SO=protein_coding / is_pseudo=false